MRVILFFILLFACISVSAQTREENLKFGDAAFTDGDYYSASIYYFNILQTDSSDISIAYKFAESCRLFNDYKNSEKWYSFVNRSDKNKDYPLAIFYLALMNKSNSRYSEAGKNFQTYYYAHKSEDSYFSKKSFQEIGSCKYAETLMKDTVSVRIEHLGKNVNTPYSEFAAQQLGDTALVFSALRPNATDEFEYLLPNFYLSKIYKSKVSTRGWATGNEMPSKINDNVSYNSNTYYTQNHKRIYFTRCNPGKLSELKCAVFVTEYKNGKWMDPVKLDEKINIPGYTSTQPSLQVLGNDEGEVLYFVSDRPGGFGKNDIWYAVYKDGKFSEPVNLGENINTPGDEISPFYYDKNKTLYFSSDWLDGLGGFDIFKAKGSKSNWETPVNMGFPMNTSCNDLYYTVNETDSDGYFTSNRPGSFFIKGETCCNDIWSYEWLKPKPKKVVKKDSIIAVLVDTNSYEEKIIDLLPLTLYFHNDIPDPASEDTVTNLSYSTTLADYIAMRQEYEKQYSEGLTGDSKAKAVKDIDEFFDDYVKTGFDKLEQFSQWLLKELQKGKDIKITIKGFCSPIQTTDYNIRLAKRRISSLKNYFSEYENGVFTPYIKGTSPDKGKLEISEDAIGESQANQLVSDNPHDQRNSIYSRGAALERKIQIVMYQTKDSLKTAKKMAQISFGNEIYNFGTVFKGEKKVYSYVFTNTGDADLIIAGVEAECGCTVTDFPKDPIRPGAKGQINILYDSSDDLGSKKATMIVYSNTKTPKKTLTFTAKVVPAGKQ